MQTIVRTVLGMYDHDTITSGSFAGQYGDQHHRELMKQGAKTDENDTNMYMVMVIAESESHSLKQKMISSRVSTCLLL
jgi:hypothetical protein